LTRPLIYQPDSFTLRAGNRLYPQSISDADGNRAAQWPEHRLFRRQAARRTAA